MRTFFSVAIPAAVAGLLAAAALAPAGAWEKSQAPRPGQAQIINIGYVSGVAYYTTETDGYHVVATLSVGGGAPVRVKATLQPEQAVSFSVPGAEGANASEVEIMRRGDTVTVSAPERVAFN
ncbi:hypothetical protein [Ancylobacter lacus]|uniref:hypothetical protein n=1 Tax=Ancylobacter lacus TaxID=2579970 RepID=UPI001BCD4477|nr:hypothetical protein [Ancylobacter lacus]MBS7540249.1 hypothetical protein [Ancylobacter lacus]